MSIENLSEQITETSEIFNDLTFNEFMLRAIEHDVVDPLNASRLLASDLDSILIEQVTDSLEQSVENHDGEPVPRRIVAPLLRVIGDFEVDEDVWFQSSFGVPWEKAPIWAIDAVNENIIVEADIPHNRIEFDPESLALFSLRDYSILMKPKQARPPKEALAHRFAIGLSAFDKTINDRSNITAVLRHFVFITDLESFKKQN